MDHDDTKRGKRMKGIWKDRRDAAELGDDMPHPFPGSQSLKSPKGSFPDDEFMKNDFVEPHSKYIEHFTRPNHNPAANRRDLPHEIHRGASPRVGEPVRFVAGSFDSSEDTRKFDSSQLFNEPNKQTVASDTKNIGEKTKTIMNVNLLMDQSGGLKIEMNTPTKEKHGKKQSSGLDTVTSNMKQTLLKSPERSSSHNTFMEHSSLLSTMNEKSKEGQSKKKQGSVGPKRSEFIQEPLNNPSRKSHLPSFSENSVNFQGSPHTLPHVSLETHQSPVNSLMDASSESETSKHMDSSKLLFDQLDNSKSGVSGSKLPELAPVSYSDEKTTVIDFAPIPSLVNVDNPLISGCSVQKCSISCPGQLWKLSSLTGCPTCECCPSVNCKLPCKHGYEADFNGCPTCKCLIEQ